MKRYVPAIIAVVVAIAVVIGLSVYVGGYRDELANVKDAIATTSHDVDMTKAQTDAENADAVKEVSGMDSVRKAKDDALIEEVFKTAFAWDSDESYMNARKTLVDTYGFDEKGQFLTVLMPEAGSLLTDEGEVSLADLFRVNMSYRNMTSYVDGIKGSTYSYVAIVTVESTDKAGHRASNDIIVIYDMDSDGHVSSVAGYAAD